MAIRSIDQGPAIVRSGPADPLNGARILVVEDEILIAMEVTSILEERGAEVVGPAHTLDVALRAAETNGISAAILDMYLGRYPVTPVAQFLHDRGVPFLFYSGQPASDPVRVAWSGTTILSKPAREWELTEALAALVPRAKDSD